MNKEIQKILDNIKTFNVKMDYLYYVKELPEELGYILREPFHQVIVPTSIFVQSRDDLNVLPTMGRIYPHTNLYACSIPDGNTIYTNCNGSVQLRGHSIEEKALSVVEIWEDMSYNHHRDIMWGYKFVYQDQIKYTPQQTMPEFMRPTLEDSKKYLS